MQLERSVVYGPIKTRRFGWDIGLNLLPIHRKVCTFDCIYCQYGLTLPCRNDVFEFPTCDEILNEWKQKIIDCEQTGMEIRHTTISGNGEPTMHPQFNKIIPELIRWRDQNAPQIKVAILSNGYRIHDPAVRSTIEFLDEPIIKLDAAIPGKFQSINKPVAQISLIEFFKDLKKCRGLVIQTMFIKGWNDELEDLLAWRNALALISPIAVQIYTVTRDTAIRGLLPLSSMELSRIADDTARITGIPVRAFL